MTRRFGSYLGSLGFSNPEMESQFLAALDDIRSKVQNFSAREQRGELGGTVTIGGGGDAPPISFFDPSATVDGTMKPGAGTAAMRSDAAPALANPFTPVGTQVVLGTVDIGTTPARTRASGNDVIVRGVAGSGVGLPRVMLETATDDATFPTFAGHRYAGSFDTPTATQNSRTLLRVIGRGYDGTSLTFDVAGIYLDTAANFTPSSQPTRILFRTTPTGAINAVNSVQVEPTGELRANFNFSVLGNTTLGDAGSDALTINPQAPTAPNLAAVTATTLIGRDASNVLGTTTALPTGSFANPTATVDGTAVNGTATTAMRSDAAPALANPLTPSGGTQAIAGGLQVDGNTVLGDASADTLLLNSQQVTAPNLPTGNVLAGESNSVVHFLGRTADNRVIATRHVMVPTTLTGTGRYSSFARDSGGTTDFNEIRLQTARSTNADVGNRIRFQRHSNAPPWDTLPDATPETIAEAVLMQMIGESSQVGVPAFRIEARTTQQHTSSAKGTRLDFNVGLQGTDTEALLLRLDGSVDAAGNVFIPGDATLRMGDVAAGQRLFLNRRFIDMYGETSLPSIRITGVRTTTHPRFEGRTSRGSLASPTASQNNDILFELLGRGHTGSAYGNANAYIQMLAAGTFTVSSQPSRILFATTPSASTAASIRLQVEPTGQVIVFNDFRVDGNTIIGDASSDTAVVNATQTNTVALWRDWPAAGIASNATVTSGYGANDTVALGAVGNVLYAPIIPYETGTRIASIRVKWDDTTVGDQVAFSLQRRDDSGTGAGWTTVTGPTTFTGGFGIQVDTIFSVNHLLLANNSYRLVVSRVGGAPVVYSVGVETNIRRY